MTVSVLSQRALNRALLARQLLDERGDRPAIELVQHLVGMQAQAPLAPYVGLWSRLRSFDPAELATALQQRTVVRATLMRGTVHLVTADDALSLHPLVEPAIARGFAGGFTGRLSPEQLDAALTHGRALLEASPTSRTELREHFRARWPQWDAEAMAYAVSYLVPTVQPTPRGLWGHRGRADLAVLTSWLGRPLDAAPSIDAVILRYLAAFGPASVQDAQAWSGLTRLREVFDRLGPELVRYRSEAGQELFDLPGAPRPDPDRPVPARLLPEYDNVLFSHRDRTRILDPRRRVPLPPGAGARTGTFLVDGRFRGTWSVRGDRLTIHPHEPLADGDAQQLLDEGTRLLEFLGVGGGGVDVAG